LKPRKLSLSITFSIALLITIYNNSTYAQSPGIKITSPIKGQQIPVDIKNFRISGIPSYNSGLDCWVSLIVNDVKPCQKGTAEKDYSSWNDVITGLTSIENKNKLIPKLSCNDNSVNLRKIYSLRVTPFGIEAYKQFTVASMLPRTISVEPLYKYQDNTIIPINEFKSIPATIYTAWDGAGNVAIPSGNNSTVGKVTIPNQPGLNNTVDHEQPYSPSNTPFVLAPPSSPSSSGLGNIKQSIQPPPIANAGPNQVVIAGSPVILNGSGSRAPGGIILSYSWRQIPTNSVITLSGVGTPVWEFSAPKVSGDTLLRFQLNVTDNLGQTGISTVNILDQPGTFHAPTTAITKSPLVTEITKSPLVTEITKSPLVTEITKSPLVTEITKSPFEAKRPSINMNRGSNSPQSQSAVPVTNPTIPPPLIPSINTRISPQAYQGAARMQDIRESQG
jgi:hypothetical protein